MKCCCCGKDIDEFDSSSYEWLPTIDPIHKKCKKDWEIFEERICTLSDAQFTSWLEGNINIVNDYL